jgi:tetratricopeptide (TPR) repeat protein
MKRMLLTLLLAAAAAVDAQIKIGPPPAGSPAAQAAPAPQGNPDDTSLDAAPAAAPAPAGGDLLSQYEHKPSARGLVSKLFGWLGSGGSPAKQAGKAYASGDYDQALQKYAEARLDQPESQTLAYNMGNAQYRKKKYDEAIADYKKALHGDDARLAASAYYNLGNAHFRKGEFSIQSGKQEGIEDYREAMANYKKSLEIKPDNKDAKRNIEVVQARIKELLDRQKQNQGGQGQPQKPPEPDDEAKKVLARALQLVAERRYAEAKTLLEDVIQKNKTAVTFQSYVQRIDDVLKIMRGETPSATQPQDPRATQPGVGVI